MTHYETLGVERSASAEAIRSAYRSLAKRHHPDIDKSAGAAAKMSTISEAYAVLSDPQRKAAYDKLLTTEDRDGVFTAMDGRVVDVGAIDAAERARELARQQRDLRENRKQQDALLTRIKAKRWTDEDPRVIGVKEPLLQRQAEIERAIALLS